MMNSFILASFFSILFHPGLVEAKLILAPSGTITPFIVSPVSPQLGGREPSSVYETPSSNKGSAWNDGVSVTPPAGEVRERLQDVVGRLQSIASRLRGVIQDTRTYAYMLVRDQGVDIVAVDRALARTEDQLSRMDAQVVALSQLFHELDAGTSDEVVLLSARTQLRRIQTTMLSGRDLLRNALDELGKLHQQPTPTPSPSSGPSATPTPTL